MSKGKPNITVIHDLPTQPELCVLVSLKDKLLTAKEIIKITGLSSSSSYVAKKHLLSIGMLEEIYRKYMAEDGVREEYRYRLTLNGHSIADLALRMMAIMESSAHRSRPEQVEFHAGNIT